MDDAIGAVTFRVGEGFEPSLVGLCPVEQCPRVLVEMIGVVAEVAQLNALQTARDHGELGAHTVRAVDNVRERVVHLPGRVRSAQRQHGERPTS